MATLTMQPIAPTPDPATHEDQRKEENPAAEGTDLSDIDSGWVVLKNSDIVSADLATAAVSGSQRLGTIPSWARWVIGGVVYTVVPFYNRVRQIEEETVVFVENSVEVVEHIAEATEKLAANVAKQLPEDGSLKKAVEEVEHIAEVVDADAEKAETITEKLSMYNASKNRGLAFVTMGSEEEASAALNNLNSTTLNDRKIKVDFARPRKKQPKQVKKPVVVSDSTEKYTLFVGNLTWRVRNRQLREFFASTPGVLSAEVIFHTTTPRRSAGYAFVSFSSKEAAEAAISTLDGQKLMGRPVNVMFKEENAKNNKSSAPKEEKAEVESSA